MTDGKAYVDLSKVSIDELRAQGYEFRNPFVYERFEPGKKTKTMIEWEIWKDGEQVTIKHDRPNICGVMTAIEPMGACDGSGFLDDDGGATICPGCRACK